MVQEFMTAHASQMFRAFTIGSPGGDNPGGNDADSRIVNFGHTDDGVFQLAPGASDIGTRAAFAALGVIPAGISVALTLAGLEEKERQGSTVYLNSKVAAVPSRAEHKTSLYLDSLQTMFDFATDGNSPFRLSALGQALADGRVYSGPSVQIAIGNPGDSLAENIDIDWRDDWVLGSAGNDRFEWEVNIRTDAHLHRIDGGLGVDTLVLTGFRSSWSWQPSGAGYQLFHSGQLVGELARV